MLHIRYISLYQTRHIFAIQYINQIANSLELAVKLDVKLIKYDEVYLSIYYGYTPRNTSIIK